MASYVTPKKNTAFKFYVGLVDQSNTKLLKANPTIAAGDFKVSTDGGAFANLATLPSANPASGRAVMIDLSASEMNGDNVVVQCVDAAGAEWCDLFINIQTTTNQIDDLAKETTLTAMKGATFDGATDSLEAIRDRGDAAWTTATGFSTLDAAGVRTAVGLASANLDTQLDALPTANENADALLGRNIAGGSSTGRTVKQALYALRNKWTAAAGTYSVYETDDVTISWTGSLSSSASADPVTGNDPA